MEGISLQIISMLPNVNNALLYIFNILQISGKSFECKTFASYRDLLVTGRKINIGNILASAKKEKNSKFVS